jgi:hypothetical protein
MSVPMSASARLAAASAVAASLLLSALPASAADLYEPPRGGAAYDDPRYGDAYGEGAYDRYAEPREDVAPADPPRAELREEDEYSWRHYGRPYRGDERGRYERACVPREVVRDRLRADGWGDFHDLDPRGRVVLVEARRPSGRLFDLTIDRCSGEILDARPIDGARSYAFGQRRYWQRPY